MKNQIGSRRHPEPCEFSTANYFNYMWNKYSTHNNYFEQIKNILINGTNNHVFLYNK